MIYRLFFILLFSIITNSTLYAVKFKPASIHINLADEIDVLQQLDIDLDFIKDPLYAKMKWNIDNYDIHYFAKAIKNDHVIIDTLKSMIDKANIPDTFLYMAMIESKFLTTAKSNKSAAGLWQLMPNTAKHLKLTIDKNIDERLDPVKSTKVAIQYLQYLHSRFHKWYLVAMAYNCGETRLAKAIKKSGTENIFVLLDAKEGYLPKETRRYLRKLIIASLIARSDHILLASYETSQESNETKLQALEVKKGTSLKKIAATYQIPEEVLKKYNAHILKGRTPKGKKKYCIYIPEDKINIEKSICSTNQTIFTYTIKKDDTLYSLSTRFNNKIATIKKLNTQLQVSSIDKHLQAGQKIALIGEESKPLKKTHLDFSTTKKTKETTSQKKEPQVVPKKLAVKDKDKIKTTKIRDKKPKKSNPKEKTFQYTTKKGDTLYGISLKFNNKISTLKRLNGELPSKLKPGTLLTIKR